ncbi:MAG: SDR family oxidoreductase [Streptosporangiales bacterium]|nr:SDR family oxidoreductase [Streptosporangiales bacterium]
MSTPTPRFHDRVAVVTGAAAGIGRAIAHQLAADGATVVVVDRDADSAATVAAELAAYGTEAQVRTVDLADRAARAGLVPDVAAALGRVDVLVNNAAALGARLELAALDEDDWATVIDTNLTATAFLSKDAALDMGRRGAGVIVNLASLQAELPLPAHIAYVASKGGIAALTRALAVELAHTGIRVNAVVPGMIGSPGLTEEFAHTAATSAAASAPAPNLVGRLGTPDEVAGVVAYLASDDAAYVTGALWEVDGGRRLSRQPDPLLADRQPAPHGKD